MEQVVKIREVYPDGTALAVHIRQSACSGDCHKCSGCGAATEAVEFTAHNLIGAGVGDVVKVESASGPVLRAAAVLYGIPLVLFFVGYWVGTLPGSFGPLGGGIGFFLGVVCAVVYDRLVMRRRQTRYEITAMAKKAGKEEACEHGC